MTPPRTLFTATLLLALASLPLSAATPPGHHFDASSNGYQLTSPTLDTSENVTLEAWLQPEPACPEGATILDKFATGSNLGYRLETGPAHTLRFLTTAPNACATQTKLPTDHPTLIDAVFSPRDTEVAIYLDGKPAASLPKANRGYDRPLTSAPLRIAIDQDNLRPFLGAIRRVAVFTRALTPDEIAARFTSRAPAPNLLADWDLTPDAPRKITPLAGDPHALLLTPLALSGAPSFPTANPSLTLWYPRPAREWVEALPVGNGRLGAMVFGDPATERLQLNQDTIWAGGPYDPANPAAFDAFAKARQLIFAGKQQQADDLLKKSAMAIPTGQAAYQTLGNLYLTFPDSESPVTNYRRSLNLDTAVATTTFTRDGTTYTREVFASAPDQLLVVHLTADKPNQIDFTATYATPQRQSKITTRDNRDLILTATTGPHANIPGQIHYEAITRAQSDGGAVTADANSLHIAHANAATLLISCGTNYVNYHDLSADPAQRAAIPLEAAASQPYESLLARHVQDHQSLFRRVTLDLGQSDPQAASLPTDQRIDHFATAHDPQLASLFFQYGRYLLISSSRPGGQPANLQGLWNDTNNPPWGGKYTININTEMNYWPAETTNLSECAQPLFAMVKDLSESGARTAKIMYHARGWVTHHNTDLWRATAPIDWPSVGMWPTGGAWLSTHLWQHYLFTGDKDFLKQSYPIFKSACEFFLDTLVKEPTHGWLVTCPSISPEHGGVVAGPAMDSQILRDLFAQTAQASEILDTDPDFRAKLLDTRAKLAPDQIGRYGQLQEWLQDKDKEHDPYRHSSHLYALFPSAQINPETPELFAAAKKSVLGRGDGGTGWALAWKINLWARALDGDHACKLLTTQLTPPKGGSQGGGTYPNLFDAHPPFQIDGNFGATSGITEMLLQSHEPFLRLLPALPTAWPTGHVTGLCARGGFTVDLSWNTHALTHATLLSRLGTPCKIKSSTPIVVRCDDQLVPAKTDGADVYEFATTAGKTYDITPDQPIDHSIRN